VAANNVYLPLWLGVSLLCVVGAAILSGLACELLFERQLPKAGWFIFGLGNPLLIFFVSKVTSVTQAFCNLLFAGAMLAFICELHRLPIDREANRLFRWRWSFSLRTAFRYRPSG
jgi:hypothetical protein